MRAWIIGGLRALVGPRNPSSVDPICLSMHARWGKNRSDFAAANGCARAVRNQSGVGGSGEGVAGGVGRSSGNTL